MPLIRVCHDLISVIHMCDMNDSYVWREWLICVTWLSHVCASLAAVSRCHILYIKQYKSHMSMKVSHVCMPYVHTYHMYVCHMCIHIPYVSHMYAICAYISHMYPICMPYVHTYPICIPYVHTSHTHTFICHINPMCVCEDANVYLPQMHVYPTYVHPSHTHTLGMLSLAAPGSRIPCFISYARIHPIYMSHIRMRYTPECMFMCVGWMYVWGGYGQ